MRNIAHQLALIASLTPATVARGEFFEKATSIGERALAFDKKSHYWFSTGFSGFDGSIETSPPDSITIDRRVEFGLTGGGEVAFQGGNGLRFHVDAATGMSRIEEKDPPKTPITSQSSVFRPAVDFTYINPKGLELVAGVEQVFVPAYAVELESDIIESETKYESVSVHAYRAAIVKRGAQWSGGFYYRQGRENTGAFEKVASDGSSIEGQRVIHQPTKFGITCDVKVSSLQFHLDLATVQEGEGGERTTTGQTVQDDFIRVRFNTAWQFGDAGIELRLAHRTLSYSAGAYTTLDTIPASDIGIFYSLGGTSGSQKVGISYETGDDGQSIPEFNAHYKKRSLAITYEVFQGW